LEQTFSQFPLSSDGEGEDGLNTGDTLLFKIFRRFPVSDNICSIKLSWSSIVAALTGSHA